MPLIKNATLVTEFKADTKKLESAMSKIGKRADKLKNQFKKVFKGLVAGAGAAAAGFVGLVAVVNNTADEIDKLGKTSDKLGILPKELQFLQFRARLAGVSTEKLNMGLQRMVRRVAEAAKGTGEAKKAIAELGLNAQELAQMSPDKQFQAIADAMGQVSNQADKVRLGFKIFDAEGVDIINTFQDNVKELRNEFDQFGSQLTTTQVKSVENYNNSWTKLTGLFSAFQLQLTAEMAPAFDLIITKVFEWVKGMGGLRPVAQSVAKFMIDALIGIVKGVNSVISGFTQLRLIMLKTIQVADQTSAVFGALVGKITAANGVDGIDQTVLSQFQRIEKRRAEIAKLSESLQSNPSASPTVKALEKIKASIGTTAIQNANQQGVGPTVLVDVKADPNKIVDVVVKSPNVTRLINQEQLKGIEATAQTVN